MFVPCSTCRCVIALSLVCLSACAWPEISVAETDTLPILELSLAPPVAPLPQVAATIRQLDDARHKSEAAFMSKLQKAKDAAEKKAKTNIGNLVGRLMRVFDDQAMLQFPVGALTLKKQSLKGSSSVSFLESGRASASSVTVHVASDVPPDPELKVDMFELEHGRRDAERAMLQQAVEDMNSLVEDATNKIEVELQLQLRELVAPANAQNIGRFAGQSKVVRGFFETHVKQSPQRAIMKVVPAESPYPTLNSLAQGMEDRRDVSEQLESAKIEMMKLDLLKIINRVVEDTLRGSVARVMAQHG